MRSLILSDQIISPPHETNANTSSNNIQQPDLTASQELEGGPLVEGVEFNRSFILTYQAAILAVIAIVTAWRWHQRRSRLRRRRARARKQKRDKSSNGETAQYLRTISQDDTEAQSSGVCTPRRQEVRTSSFSESSTLRSGNTTPPSKDEPETSPLLPRESRSQCHNRALNRPSSYLRTCLTYQPPPLPLLHRTLPPNSTTLLILFLSALNLFYLLYKIPFSTSTTTSSTTTTIIILADRASLLFTANLPHLYLLAAKNQPLKLLTHDSYENLNLLHRRQGEWMCFLAALHFGGMLVAWYISDLSRVLSLWDFLTIRYILWGIGAWVAYEVLYLGSLGTVREWCYEVFLAGHVGLQGLALVGLWMHHFRARAYVFAALVIFVLDRVVWRLGVKTMTIEGVGLEVMEDGETVKVSGNWGLRAKKKIEGKDACNWHWRRLCGYNMEYGYEPSEHVFISVPDISTRHKMQFHPMTIASAAPEDGGHAWFNLIIRARGGFSKDLRDYARLHSTATVRLDGPYGSLHALEMLRAADVAVIVAGGSGIAVAYPMLWNLLHLQDGEKRQVGLIWVVQDASHISWIGNERLEELRELGCQIILPPPSRQHGRPNVPELLREHVDELSERFDDKVGIVVSGPDGLNRAVRNTCAGMLWKGRDVEVSVEKFGW